MRIGRRELLKTSVGLAGGAWAGGCETSTQPPLAGAPADLESTVAWIEETPRGDVFDVAAEKLAAGLTTRQLLAAGLVASARSLPLDPVGLWLHPFFTLHSIERMSLDAPWSEHLVPYFYWLDAFKNAQEESSGTTSDLLLGAVDETALPPVGSARDAFRAAMDTWDRAGADAAITAMVRGLSSAEVTEELLLYGCRDLAPIGHHVILTTQVLRTIDLVGWPYAETPVRAIVRGLLEAGQDTSTTTAFAAARARAATIRADWEQGAPSDSTSLAVLAMARAATSDGAASAVADLLDGGASARSVLDGLLLADAELVLQFPAGSAVFAAFHALTNANGFRHVFRTSRSSETRLVALLQAAAFYPLERAEAISRAGDDTSTPAIDTWDGGSAPASLDAVFDRLADDRVDGAGALLSWLQAGGAPSELIDAARRIALVKGMEEHDYKLPVAVFEEHDDVAPAFRAQLLAASAVYLRIPSDPDWARHDEAKAAIAKVLAG